MANKIFDLYDISEVKVTDPALKKYINFDYKLVLKNRGRHTDKFGKSKVNIIEIANNISKQLTIKNRQEIKEYQLNVFSYLLTPIFYLL